MTQQKQQWYFKTAEGIEVGPIASKALLGHARQGRVQPDTKVRLGEDGQWVDARRVDGLFPDAPPKKKEPVTDNVAIQTPPKARHPKPAAVASPPPPKAAPVSETAASQAPSASSFQASFDSGEYPMAPGMLDYPGSDSIASEKIVCPHCWGKFAFGAALYVASHPELRGDPVLGPEAASRFLPSRFTEEGHAIDSRGLPCPDMACPRCHLRIPETIIDLKSIFFSIIGAPSSGKSYFLAAMNWKLENTFSPLFHFSLTDADPESNAIINEYIKKLFLNPEPSKITMLPKTQTSGDLYNQLMLNDMVITLPKPFIYRIQPTATSSIEDEYTKNIILYDNAGEHFLPGNEDISRPATRHLVRSNGLIFLFDPSLDARMRLQCDSDDPQLSDVSKIANQQTLLTEMINRVRKYGGMKPTSKYQFPLVIAAAKYDMWKSLLPEDIDADYWYYDEDEFVHKLDYNKILNVSYQLRELFLKTCPSIVNLAEAFSSRVLFLPVSSLGTAAEEFTMSDGKTVGYGVRPENIKPTWVCAPILMQLATHGYVPLGDGGVGTDEAVDIEKFRKVKDTAVFSIPGSKGPTQLPSIYFGARLRHPETNAWFKVPGERLEWELTEHERSEDDFWN